MSIKHIKNRSERVAARLSRKTLREQIESFFLSDNAPQKFCLFFLTTLILCVTVEAWKPPFPFRQFSIPDRDITCATPFSLESPQLTNEARQAAAFDTPHIYINDPAKFSQFKAELVNTVQSLLAIDSYDKMLPEDQELWSGFLPKEASSETAADLFTKLQEALANDPELQSFKASVDKVFQPFAENGILLKLHLAKDGNQELIQIYDVGATPADARNVPVRDVLIGNAYAIKDALNWEFNREISDLLIRWIRSNVRSTLAEDLEATAKARKAAEEAVEPRFSSYEAGQVIAVHGKEIDSDTLKLLSREYQVFLEQRTWKQNLTRFFGIFVFIFVANALSNFIINLRPIGYRKRGSFRSFLTVYLLIILTAVVGRFIQVLAANQYGNPEMIPVLVFAQGMTIAFSWQVGIVTSFMIALALSLSGTMDLPSFLIFLGVLSTMIFLSSDIRHRGQSIWGAAVGGVAIFLLSLAAGLFQTQSISVKIVNVAVMKMIWVILSGFLMSGLLPLVERIFGILTPVRLLEIGNPSHPLLQELSRKAPATYSHSMLTASIAESAAEAIGARASLVRVGAYFHDIGKILKPEYFTENQKDFNIHDTLEPRLSTLIIVAHVKDGIDLGRQYGLPQPIIDLIQQHHGTMLVSFFYTKANQASLEATGQGIDDGPFRYPGPIPQSKEAGILMLADAVESASRSLGDVSPGKIENLIHQLTEKRMEDGQLDESGLTLGEIRTIENSMITSLLAMKHNRIKYPDEKKKERSEGVKSENGAKSENGTKSESGAKNGNGSKGEEGGKPVNGTTSGNEKEGSGQ